MSLSDELQAMQSTAARGHNLVLVTPPAPAYSAPALAGLLGRLAGTADVALVLCPSAQLDEWSGLATLLSVGTGIGIQAAHGTARAQRRLKEGALQLLVAAPDTALALVRRSALKVEALVGIVLAFPEAYESDEALSALMQDLPKDAQRIVVTAAGERQQTFVERYARKALTLGGLGPDATAPPAVGPVRTVSVPWHQRVSALADVVELLDPHSVAVWAADRSRAAEITRVIGDAAGGLVVATEDAPAAELVIAFDLPTLGRLTQLLAVAKEVVLLVPPGAEGYVERIAAPRRALRLPGLLEAATHAAAAHRAAIQKALESTAPEHALLVLAPLFERYDPSLVAATLYDLWLNAASAAPTALPDIPATAKLYVNVGKQDGATANDLVAVLTKDVRLDKAKIGRIELRDAYSLVEVPATEAERIAAAMNGMTVRRKRLSVRVDRGPSRPPERGSDRGGERGAGRPTDRGPARPGARGPARPGGSRPPSRGPATPRKP